MVEPNFLPEIGFLARTDMRRNFGQVRFSPRPTSIAHVRKFTTQANINYVTNNENRLDTREIVGVFQTELVNTDVAGVMYTDGFDRLTRPFDVAPGVRIPIGAYTFNTLQVSYTGGQQRKISGAIVYETGEYYGGNRQSIVGERRAHGGDAARIARTEPVGQPRGSAARLVHGDGRADARDVYGDAPDVRQRHRAVQLHDELGRQQFAAAVGVRARQRAVRRLHRRLRHGGACRADGTPQSRLRRQVESLVPAVRSPALRARPA